MQALIVVTILNLGVTTPATTPAPSKWEFDKRRQVLTSMPYVVITIDPIPHSWQLTITLV